MTAPSEDRLVDALRASLTQNERLRAQNEQLGARNEELAGAAHEPIAIVGMSCRYPGSVSSAEDLWRLVVDGTDAIGDLPDDRGWKQQVLDLAATSDGIGPVPQGGFVDHVDRFDPAVFPADSTPASSANHQTFTAPRVRARTTVSGIGPRRHQAAARPIQLVHAASPGDPAAAGLDAGGVGEAEVVRRTSPEGVRLFVDDFLHPGGVSAPRDVN